MNLPESRTPMPLPQAVSFVLRSVFQQVDQHWPDIMGTLRQLLAERGLQPGDEGYMKLSLTVASIALNARAAFDVMSREQGEVVFSHHMLLLQQHFPNEVAFQAVQNTVLKYVDAYNHGVLAIRHPAHEIAHLLYYKMGFQNVEQRVVDEKYFAADPHVVEYLARVLGYFSGKWEILMQHHTLT